MHSNTDTVMARSSADPDFGRHKLTDPTLPDSVDDLTAVLGDFDGAYPDPDDELAVFMTDNGGIHSDSDNVWFERFDFRPDDPDGLVTGTTQPYLRAVLVA